MKKLFSFLFFTFLLIKSFAQLDTEHWFAPMIDRVNNGDEVQTIYFSTNVTTPFPVTIYNNNLPIGTVTVSKGNPQKFSVPRPYIITLDTKDTFKATKMGLYTKGEQPYFANLRFSIYNHAEILTSKGKAGIGTKFFAAMAPITVNGGILNFMTGILATEDNTNVTVSGYQPNVIFGIAQGNTITFTLNKGESYIIDGRGSIAANRLGFIGAKIISNKPISVTNGNFNGQYAGNFSSSSDILMDQSVPVDRLGQEFALVKGNGLLGQNMEGGLIIATENDTQIYVNDIASPAATLNEGQYYRVPESFYNYKGGGVFNMYIKSTKNIYLYQLLAGSATGNVEATGGFNYIPPLSCYLPKKIDEIGLIDENLTYSNNYPTGQLQIPTKLNIITASGAAVTVNGVTPTAAEGPYPLIGNSSWETYSVENVSGNITVVSTKSVTAGIAAGDGAVGYGGYFAGFSSVPAIAKKSGICIPGVVLEVQEGFDSYQWLSNGVEIPGANSNTFEPTVAGIYTVKVTNGSCPPVTTLPFTILKCPTLTTLTKSICSPFKTQPAFTNSTQNIVLSSIQIKTPPTKGTATINPATGEITYSPNIGAVGADSFVYRFCGDGTFEECEEVTVNITIGQLVITNDTLTSCKVGTTGLFNLSNANITTTASVTKNYYSTLIGAQNETAADEITNFTAFPSAGGDVYAVVKTPEGCSEIAIITLKLFPEIILDTTLYDATTCDDNLDGSITVDFSTISPEILQNSTYFQVRYYLNLNDANALNNNFLPNNWSYSADATVYVRVISPDGCDPGKGIINFKIGAKVAITSPLTKNVCSVNDSQGIILSDYILFFTTDPGVTFEFFSNLADAQANIPGTEILPEQTISGDITFFFRFSKAGVCDNIGILNLKFAKATASTTLPPAITICAGTTTVLNAGPGFTSYLWNTGENTPSITVGVGTYYVDITSPNGCTIRQTVEVKEFPKVVLDTALYTATNCDDNLDGKIDIDLSTINPIILQNSTYFEVRYYLNLNDANASNNNFLANNWSYSADTTVYVRVISPDGCAPGKGIINFKIGAKVAITSPVTKTVCSANTSENIVLSDYLPFFTTDSATAFKFYKTLTDAQANISGTDVSANETISADTTYYVRFSKAGLCDAIGILKLKFAQAVRSSTLPASITICEGSTAVLNAGTGFTAYLWSTGETSPSITAVVGTYTVTLTSPNGCSLVQSVEVKESLKAVLNAAAYTTANCDDDFDGFVNIKFSDVTPVILPLSAGFTIRYYSTPAFAQAGGNNNLADNYAYSSDVTVFVRVESSFCPPVIQALSLKVGNSLPLIKSTAAVSECDDDLDSIKSVDLTKYVKEFTSDSGVNVSFYDNLQNAQKSQNAVSNPVSVTKNGIYYFRLSKTGFCPVIASLNLTINVPRASAVLVDKNICPDTQTVLDAGVGFKSYLWNTGENTPTITVGVGEYYVDLETQNGCIYRQKVSVKEVDLPVITVIDIQGSTVTITAEGGNKPYLYSLNGSTPQTSNVFTNVQSGSNTIFVTSADQCDPVSKEFSLIKITNAITPNGDGKNDTFNYSDLSTKDNPKFEIYDRYGKIIFTGSKINNFTWDGTSTLRKLPTDSYWYVLEWREFGTQTTVKQTGWVLLKNY